VAKFEERVNKALDLVASGILKLGLVIATEETKAVLFTKRYKYAVPRIEIRAGPVTVSTEMTYFDITMDKTLLFKVHVRRATEKAERVGAQLARLMPNVGGPRKPRR